jgi:hypothetical protein
MNTNKPVPDWVRVGGMYEVRHVVQVHTHKSRYSYLPAGARFMILGKRFVAKELHLDIVLSDGTATSFALEASSWSIKRWYQFFERLHNR